MFGEIRQTPSAFIWKNKAGSNTRFVRALLTVVDVLSVLQSMTSRWGLNTEFKGKLYTSIFFLQNSLRELNLQT